METTESKKIEELQKEIENLKARLRSGFSSPNLQRSFETVHIRITLQREEIVKHELNKRISEDKSSLYEIKELIRRFAPLVGVDPDSARISATEALQNLIEHGDGPYAEFMMDINNNCENPYLKMSFKHEILPGKKYTLADINKNVRKGDITSGEFDFESSRGRGEFIMKELTDERRILNGVELLPDGRKIHYFQRILINYKDPKGPRAETSFDEIRDEIRKLDNEDVVCYFHLDNKKSELKTLTVVVNKSKEDMVRKILFEKGFQLKHKDTYYRSMFLSFEPPENHKDIDLDGLFHKIRKKVEAESE